MDSNLGLPSQCISKMVNFLPPIIGAFKGVNNRLFKNVLYCCLRSAYDVHLVFTFKNIKMNK